ncbi:MAG: CvpA family protein [Odoribacter sp.]|nr:CvpA family protein [Bacteroidales bacterium]MBR2981177.1 CvpA family protein [Odoribacter sp.]
MDKIDIAFFIVLGVALLRGFFKGLAYEVISLCSVIAGLAGGIYLSPLLKTPLTGLGLSDSVAHFSAGVIIFLLIVFVVNIVCKLIFSTDKVGALGMFDNLIGAFISCIKYSIMLCALLLIINNFNNNYHIFADSHVEGSTMYNSYLEFAQTVYKSLK